MTIAMGLPGVVIESSPGQRCRCTEGAGLSGIPWVVYEEPDDALANQHRGLPTHAPAERERIRDRLSGVRIESQECAAVPRPENLTHEALLASYDRKVMYRDREMPNAVGGALCLDFLNTVDPRHAAARREYLSDYGALVAWARYVNAIGEGEAKRLLSGAKRAPSEAERVLRRALRLRESLYRVFANVTQSAIPPRVDLQRLNSELARAMGKAKVVYSTKGFSWKLDEPRPRLDSVLWPVVRSAADLLVHGELQRVRECPGDAARCGWLFLDSSKNARRRWCEMRSCGNRAKARRHYSRVRAGQESERRR
jgi:predicted RNA-binding Zn ribbon-like protein